jgi:hypothetical protein
MSNPYRTLKPSDYIKEFYPGSKIRTATIINWIKGGKLHGKQTPTGRWLVVVGGESEKDPLLAFLES